MNIHGATNMVCACLPVYGPLRAKVNALVASLRHNYGSRSFLVPGAGWNKMRKSSTSNKRSNDLGLNSLDLETRSLRATYPARWSSGELVLSPHDAMHATVVERGDTSHIEAIPNQAIARTTKVEVV